MNVLLVHAHPEPKSFTSAMKDLAVETLGEMGHQVVVSDLYDMGFSPVSGPDDFQERQNADYLSYGLEQRHGYKTGTLAPDIAQEVAKLVKADLLVLSFPVYWFSVPAILKGWIDRTFLSGLCFGGRRFYDRGGLKGRRAMIAFSTGSQEHMLTESGVHGSVERMLAHIEQGSLAYVGMEVLPHFAAWHVPFVSEERRREMLHAYREHLFNLESMTPKKYRSLDEFDDNLQPLAG